MEKPLDLLQACVAASKTDHQARTGVNARALFLSTECGEDQKEVLRLGGHYGPLAQGQATERIARELCDVIWNACDLASQLGIGLDSYMDEMLRKNAIRNFKEKT